MRKGGEGKRRDRWEGWREREGEGKRRDRWEIWREREGRRE